MQVTFKVFKSMFRTWESLFAKAATFASQLPPNRIISISHAVDRSDEGTVTVWYWEASAEQVSEEGKEGHSR
jgi:hypothetical protein